MSTRQADGHSGSMTGVAIVLGIAGSAFLFAPAETLDALSGTASLVPSLLGAALVGYAVMAWTARGSRLGGIYGRAVVAGAQAHFFIGAFVLLRRGLPPADAWIAWGLTLVYVCGAIYFTYLMFFSTGLGGGGDRSPTS